ETGAEVTKGRSSRRGRGAGMIAAPSARADGAGPPGSVMEALMPFGRFFRHSPADAFLAVAGLGHVAFLLFTFLAFASLPWWALAVSFLTYSLLICWNLQCISHNFIHNPFFVSRWLNRAFGVLESIAIGMPHQLYHHYHMNHH